MTPICLWTLLAQHLKTRMGLAPTPDCPGVWPCRSHLGPGKPELLQTSNHFSCLYLGPGTVRDIEMQR